MHSKVLQLQLAFPKQISSLLGLRDLPVAAFHMDGSESNLNRSDGGECRGSGSLMVKQIRLSWFSLKLTMHFGLQPV